MTEESFFFFHGEIIARVVCVRQNHRTFTGRGTQRALNTCHTKPAGMFCKIVCASYPGAIWMPRFHGTH